MSDSCLDALNRAVDRLRSEGIDRPRTNAELLLGAVLHAKKIDLYLGRDRILTPQQIDKFDEFIRERISSKPVQYIIGSTEFFGLEFTVNESVLIPRPETETLVETVIQHLKDCPQPKIVDLGTGSGAIAVSLAKNLKDPFVFATDISPDALKVAEQNARTNQVTDQIDFLCGDLFEPLKDRKLEGVVDCVASNPPYVSREEFDRLPKEVKEFEPIVALKTDQEGTFFHEKIIRGSAEYLKEEGLLALEVGLGQAERVADLVRDSASFDRVRVMKDLGGIERIVIARKR
jgi:release factor glutamine methyltransferase